MQPFDLDGHRVLVTVSIGVALVPADGIDEARLLQNADIALYRAKNAGRNRFCFFEAGMDQQLRDRRRLEGELRSALAEGQLELHYQPQIDIAHRRGGRGRGAAALAPSASAGCCIRRISCRSPRRPA